jgi:hypothetical protein
MKNCVKKLIYSGVLLVMTLFSFAACTTRIPWHGIPQGIYSLLDENGDVIGGRMEDAWAIGENKAEYEYLTYKIIEEDEKLYFELNMPEPEYSHMRYEASYDKKTKILTVYMSSTEDGKAPLVSPDPESKITAFCWKKTRFY